MSNTTSRTPIAGRRWGGMIKLACLPVVALLAHCNAPPPPPAQAEAPAAPTVVERTVVERPVVEQPTVAVDIGHGGHDEDQRRRDEEQKRRDEEQKNRDHH